MSKKSRAEWNILINSTNTKAMNIFAIVAFGINALLYTYVGITRSFKDNKLDSYTVLGFLWAISVFVSFFRMFYQGNSNCLAKTLPNSRRIYTKKIPVIFLLMNLSFIPVILPVYLYHNAKGTDTSVVLLVILIYCAFTMAMALCVGKIIQILSHVSVTESLFGTVTKWTWQLLFVFVAAFSAIGLLAFLLAHFQEDVIYFFEAYPLIYAILCAVLLICSWVVTLKTFKKLYASR